MKQPTQCDTKKTNSVRCFAAILFIACASLTYALTPTNPGDLNADFAVNILDIQIISGCLGQSASSCQSGRADPNNDNTINIFDFVSVSQHWGRTYSPIDTTPPSILTTNPTNGQTLAAGTTTVTITITTNEPATCKDGANNLAYAALPNTMTGAGTTTHTEAQINRQDGRTYTRYIACQDVAGNTMSTSTALVYSIANTTTPTCGNGAQEGTEQCDLGTSNGACPSTCSATCTTNTCSAPTATLTANPTSITSGTTSTLSWSSTSATTCTASAGWTGTKTTSGTQNVNPTSTTTYTITCTGPTGTSTPASTTITVTAANNCGNGNIDAGEQCDGTNLNAATCTSLGYTGGTLSCSAICQYVTSSCTTSPPPSGSHEPAGLTPIIDLDFGSTLLPTAWTSAPSTTYGLNLGKAHSAGGQSVPSPNGYAHRQTFGLNTVTARGVGADIFAKENLAGNTDGNSAHSYRIWYERGTFYFGGKNGEQSFENGGSDGFKLLGYWGGMCPGNMQATQLILWGAPLQAERNTWTPLPVTDWQTQIRWNAGCSPTNNQPWSTVNNPSWPTFTAGTWHTYEVLLDAGDIDQANGKVTLWIDGTQVATTTQTIRTSSASRGWYGRLWDPVYNGKTYMLSPATSPTPTNASKCTSLGQIVDGSWTCVAFKKNRVDVIDTDDIYVSVGQQID